MPSMQHRVSTALLLFLHFVYKKVYQILKRIVNVHFLNLLAQNDCFGLKFSRFIMVSAVSKIEYTLWPIL